MSESEEIKKAADQAEFRARVEGKLDNLHAIGDDLKDSLSKFNFGMGKRIDEMQKTILEHAILMPALKEGVDDWKESKKWILRIVVGGVIMALLALVLVKK